MLVSLHWYKCFDSYSCRKQVGYCHDKIDYVSILGLQPFNLNTSVCDWHFSEFSSCMNFALYCCCVELMALPLPGKDVARQLIETIYTKYVLCSKSYDAMMMSL